MSPDNVWRRYLRRTPSSTPHRLHSYHPSTLSSTTQPKNTMKFTIAVFVAFVAMASAFVPSTSCRGVISASRARSTTPLVSNPFLFFDFDFGQLEAARVSWSKTLPPSLSWPLSDQLLAVRAHRLLSSGSCERRQRRWSSVGTARLPFVGSRSPAADVCALGGPRLPYVPTACACTHVVVPLSCAQSSGTAHLPVYALPCVHIHSSSRFGRLGSLCVAPRANQTVLAELWKKEVGTTWS